jgi:parallel beta-helix repeat protein
MGIMLLLPTAVMLSREISAYTPHAPILIDGDADFIPTNGVSSGSGSWNNPYVIENWDISASTAIGIDIRNTDKHFVIRDAWVHSGGSIFEGIFLYHTTNGTVQNTSISDNRVGINIDSSANTTIISSTISQNGNGILLVDSNRATIASNTISNNSYGVNLLYSSDVTLTSNTFHYGGLALFGDSISHFNTHAIAEDNLVNGLPLYYRKDCDGLVIDGIAVGQLIVANCKSVRLSNLSMANSSSGIELAFTDDVLIDENDISKNEEGVFLAYSNNATLIHNSLRDNRYGVFLLSSANATITSSSIVNNSHGIYSIYSNSSKIVFNAISGNSDFGVRFWDSKSCRIDHNAFVDNGIQSYDSSGSENSWDSGYPDGGNYWSDYSGEDQFGGPNQDQPGSDGIGDTPYVIDIDSADRYPLMNVLLPRVFIASPTGNQIFATTPIVVTGTASDAGGSGLSRVEVRVNSGSWLTANGTSSWNLSVDLASGSNLIEARAWDNANNPSIIVSINVTCDTISPQIAHTPTADVFVGETVPIRVNVTDNVGLNHVQMRYRGAGQVTFTTVNMTYVGGDDYETVIPAQDVAGIIEYYITAEDKAGNLARLPDTGEFTVNVKEKPAPEFPWWIIVLLVVVVVALLLLLMIRKKTPKEEEQSSMPPASPPGEPPV